MIYRKHGRSVRWEDGMLVRVTESGWAREEGERFECGPLRDANASLPDVDIEPYDALRPRLPRNVALERLLVTRGVAEHEYGDARWSERTDRVHLSLTRPPLRLLFDGTIAQLGEVAEIAVALAESALHERPAPARLRLAPRVVAALIPSLVEVAPPNVRLVQSAGGVDGYGAAVTETSISFFRPSYRVRPVKMPFNVRVECGVTTIEDDRPSAIALLGPIDRMVLPLLVRDRGLTYPTRVRLARIDAVATERTWYPIGAGSFGAEMML